MQLCTSPRGHCAQCRTRPSLIHLDVHLNKIDDEGVAALVAALGEDAFSSLEFLHLHYNSQITDEGCAALNAAVRDGRLPNLQEVYLHSTKATKGAKDALKLLLRGRGTHTSTV